MHWRAHITQLLSVEFLRLAKSRLEPGGILYYNTTSSDDVAYTAAQVFTHVVRYRNFIAVSDRPFEQSPHVRRERPLRFAHAGRPALASARARPVLEELATLRRSELGPRLRSRSDLWLITDDNMATEFKTAGAGAWWRTLKDRLYDPG